MNKTNLTDCLEELHFPASEFRKALARHQEQTGIKISTSKQAFYNWQNRGKHPSSPTRIAALRILNLVRAERGLEGEYAMSEVFPERPYEELKAKDLKL